MVSGYLEVPGIQIYPKQARNETIYLSDIDCIYFHSKFCQLLFVNNSLEYTKIIKGNVVLNSIKILGEKIRSDK